VGDTFAKDKGADLCSVKTSVSRLAVTGLLELMREYRRQVIYDLPYGET